MGGKWSAQNLKEETKFKPKWKHQPSVAVRVPECFRERVLKLASALDNLELLEAESQFALGSTMLALRSWELWQLLKLQSELPKLIQEKKEACQDRRLEEAILFLAGQCDGARERDGVGFNAFDAGFGRWLAQQIEERRPLLRKHAEMALQMLQKYVRQLDAGGYSLPEWSEVWEQYSAKSQPLPKLKSKEDDSEYLPEYRIEIKGRFICTYSPYDSSGKYQRIAKTIEFYNFEREDSSWRFPLNKVEEVLEKFKEYPFVIAPEVEGLVEIAKMERAEQESAKQAQALDAATEIIKLVEAADLNSPLSNGWDLREYQKQGAEWLLAHRKGGIYEGGILADQMGLGKTLTALCAARAMQKLCDCSVFVIAPVSLLEGWQRAGEMAQVSIEIFSNSYQKIPAPLENKKYLIICDEAHGFQDPKSKRTEKLFVLAEHENCLTTWLLTGTPIKNGRPINLLPLLMLIKHPVASNKLDYMKRYCNGHYKYVGKKEVWDVTGSAHLDELSQKTEDVILRRKKDEVLKELPAKTRLFERVYLEGQQAENYKLSISLLAEDFRQRAKAHLFKSNLRLFFKIPIFKGWLSWVLAYNPVDKNAEALAMLGIMRRVGSSYKVGAAVDYALELLEQGQQVVVFTEFLDSAKEIYARLTKEGINCELLTGESETANRQTKVDKFQAGESKVFVGTIKAGGVGLTLTAASNVLLVDRAFTPGECEQAEDRVHRISQQSAVFATWLKLGAVDDAIDDLILQKSERIELVLKGKRKTLKGIRSPKHLAEELLAIL